MIRHFLDFERPVAELEAKIEELRHLSTNSELNIADEVVRLQNSASRLLRQTYSRLTPWQKVQVARHPERPHALDYIGGLIADFVPLAGDRAFAEDLAVIGGIGRFRGRSVLVIGTEHKNAAPTEAADTADDRRILGKCPVAAERHELGNQPADVIEAMRSLGMPRHVYLLPRRQPRIGLAQQSVGRAFKAADLVGDVELAGGGKMAQFFDLAFELCDGPFEIEEMADHLRRARGWPVSTSLRSRSVRTCV